MAHHTVRSGYRNLVERLNRFPQGAPPSKLLYRILEMLFSEEEAEFVSLLPIKPFTAKTASTRWKISLSEVQTMLDALSGRGILLDIEENASTSSRALTKTTWSSSAKMYAKG